MLLLFSETYYFNLSYSLWLMLYLIPTCMQAVSVVTVHALLVTGMLCYSLSIQHPPPPALPPL